MSFGMRNFVVAVLMISMGLTAMAQEIPTISAKVDPIPHAQAFVALEAGAASIKTNLPQELDKKGNSYSLLVGRIYGWNPLTFEGAIGFTQTHLEATSPSGTASKKEKDEVTVRSLALELTPRYRVFDGFDVAIKARLLLGSGVQFSPSDADKKNEAAFLVGPQLSYEFQAAQLIMGVRAAHLVDTSIKNRVLQTTTLGFTVGI